MTSLKTLAIHLSETSKEYIRRRYEPRSSKVYMKGKTAGQPNARMTRSLRCCHGIDYVYQLRGLYWVHVYDMDKGIQGIERHPVRDRSFELDLQRVVTQKKIPQRAKASAPRRLQRLFPSGGWEPLKFDFLLIRQIFAEQTGYSNIDNTLDLDDTVSMVDSSPSVSPDTSDNDDDDDDDEGSDGEPDSGRGRNYYPPTPPDSAERTHQDPVEIISSDEDADTEVDDSDTRSHSSSSTTNEADACHSADARSTDNIRNRRCRQYIRRQNNVFAPDDADNAD